MHRAALASSFVVVLVACASAQAKPDFSGNWTIVGPNTQVARTGGRSIDIGSPLPDTCTVKHDAKAVVFQDSGGATLFSVALDGSETRQRITPATPTPARGGRAVAPLSSPRPAAEQELIRTAAWDGNRLVITTRRSNSTRGAAGTLILSIGGDGALMFEEQIESSIPAVTFVYKRAPSP